MKAKQQLPIKILLADDDVDDCSFFAKALDEISIKTHLTTVKDGEQLMDYLNKNKDNLPLVLFLDLSMPRKTGFECLSEIRENIKYENLHVVMFSTSYSRDINYEQGMIDTLYEIGANDYIRKPGGFENLKKTIQNVLEKLIVKSKM